MSTTIEINDNIQIVTITVVDEDNTVTLQPVVTRNGGVENTVNEYQLNGVTIPIVDKVLNIEVSENDITNTGNDQFLNVQNGVVVQVGDSNTNGRPDYRINYEREWFGEGELFEGWIPYNIGQNGSTLQGWVNSIDVPSADLLADFDGTEPGANIQRVINGDADGRPANVIFICLGTNDLSTPTNRATIGTEPVLRENLNTLVRFLLENTDAYIVLRMPQPFVNEDFSGITQWANDAEVIASNLIIATVYREWINVSPRITVYDTQSINLFGAPVVNKATDGLDPITGLPMIADALHPNSLGYRRIIQGMTHQLTSGRYIFPLPEYKNEFPEDFVRNGSWGATFFVKQGGAYSDNNLVFEIFASQQQAQNGAFWNNLGTSGEGYTLSREVIKNTSLAPKAIFSQLKSLTGTIYLYDFENDVTHELTNFTDNNWVVQSPTSFAQVSGDFVGTNTLGTGKFLFYTKNQAPFSGTIGDEVVYGETYKSIKIGSASASPSRLVITNTNTTAANSLAIQQTTTGNLIDLKPQGFSSKAIVIASSAGREAIQINLTNPQINDIMSIDLNDTATYLSNNRVLGFDINLQTSLDNISTKGISIFAQNSRPAKGTNNNTVTVLELEGGALTATDIPSEVLKMIIKGTNTRGLVVEGFAGQTASYIDIKDSAGTNVINVSSSGILTLSVPTYADDTAAGVGGLTANQFYKTATGELRIKL